MINTIITKFKSENTFSYYAAFFRVFICFFLLKDILVLWNFTDLIFLSDSFLQNSDLPIFNFFGIDMDIIHNNFVAFRFVYIGLIFMFMFGIGRRYTAILVYLFMELMQSMSYITMNGGDNLLKFTLLYFIFMDSYERYSIKPLKFKRKSSKELSNFFSNLAGYSILIHFCLVYFVSVMHKIHADVWFNGVATYYIFSLDRFNGTPWNLDLVKNGYFVTITTYGTLFIELFFPFLVWNKRLKYIFLILAASMHLGIAVFMMLYDFQIFFIISLGFFINNDEWKVIIMKINNLTSKTKKFFTRRILKRQQVISE